MNKEFVPYTESLALKELGFDDNCSGYYATAFNKTDFYYILPESFGSSNADDVRLGECTAPTYSQAFRWFREKYRLYSEITLDSYKEPYSLKVTIKHLDSTHTFVNKEYLPYSNGIGDIDNKNYEEAELDCLKKLIEIVKNI